MIEQSVILLTNSSVYSKSLVNHLKKKGIRIEKVLIEKQKKRFAYKNVLVKLLGTFLYRKTSVSLFPDKSKLIYYAEEDAIKSARELFKNEFENYSNNWTIPNIKIYHFKNINSNEVKNILLQSASNLILVFGTSILKEKLLETNNKFLNLHTSILPSYRGVFPEFWQIFNKDKGSYGITFHFIDAGVDTGNIISQHETKYKGSNPYILRVCNLLNAFNYYPLIIDSIFSNSYKEKKQAQSKVRAYKYKEITLDKKYTVFKKAGYLK